MKTIITGISLFITLAASAFSKASEHRYHDYTQDYLNQQNDPTLKEIKRLRQDEEDSRRNDEIEAAVNRLKQRNSDRMHKMEESEE